MIKRRFISALPTDQIIPSFQPSMEVKEGTRNARCLGWRRQKVRYKEHSERRMKDSAWDLGIYQSHHLTVQRMWQLGFWCQRQAGTLNNSSPLSATGPYHLYQWFCSQRTSWRLGICRTPPWKNKRGKSGYIWHHDLKYEDGNRSRHWCDRLGSWTAKAQTLWCHGDRFSQCMLNKGMFPRKWTNLLSRSQFVGVTWIYCLRHTGVPNNARADRLPGKALKQCVLKRQNGHLEGCYSQIL